MSLLERLEIGNATRYRLSPVFREYARRRAESLQIDVEAVQKRYVDYYVPLALANCNINETAKKAVLDREWRNMTTALEWCARHDVSCGLRVAADLWQFWWRCGYARIGMERIILLLNHADSSLPEWAEATFVAGHLSRHVGEFVQAKTFFNESLKTFKQNNDPSGAARVLRQLGVLAWNQHQWDDADLFIDEALVVSRLSGKPEDIAETGYELGNLRRYQERYDEAAKHLNDSLIFFRQAGNTQWIGTALLALGNVTVRMKQMDSARCYYAESLKLFDAIQDKGKLALITERIAAYGRLRGRFNQAAVLIGVAEKLRKDIGTSLPGPDGKEYFDQLIADLKQALGADYDKRREQGRSLSLNEAIKKAGQEVE